MMMMRMMKIWMMIMTCPGDQLYQLQGFSHPLSPKSFHFDVSWDFDIVPPEYLPLDLPNPKYWHHRPETERHHQLHHLCVWRNIIIVTILSAPAAPYRPCSAVQVGIHWSFPFQPITCIDILTLRTYNIALANHVTTYKLHFYPIANYFELISYKLQSKFAFNP